MCQKSYIFRLSALTNWELIMKNTLKNQYLFYHRKIDTSVTGQKDDNSLFLYFMVLKDNLLISSASFRSSHPEAFLGKGVLKICSKFTGEHPCRSVIWIKLLCIFIAITLRHGCSPCKFAAYFQRTFSQEHVLVTASALYNHLIPNKTSRKKTRA